MPSFPARPQAQRSAVAGRLPPILNPGAFAINWADRKLYVGDPGGVPLLISTLLRDWTSTQAFAAGDLTIRDGELYQALVPIAAGHPFDTSEWLALTTNAIGRYSEPTATGMVSGGGLATGGGALVAVTAGSGIIVLDGVFTAIEWDNFSAAVPMTGVRQALAVTLDANVTIGFKTPSQLTREARRSLVVLGWVWTSASAVTAVLAAPVLALRASETSRDEYQVNGGPYRVRGARIQPHAALGLQITSGLLYALGVGFAANADDPNVKAVSAASPLGFVVIDRTGAQVGAADAIDPTKWDNAGTVSTVTNGKTTIMYVSCDAAGGHVTVQLGQAQYDSLAAAAAALPYDWEDYVKADQDLATALLGAILVIKSATDITNATHATVMPAMPGRGAAFIKPSTDGDGDTSDFLLLDGSRPMAGDLDMDGNSIRNAEFDGGTF